MKTIRIQSTRANIVGLPPGNFGDDARKAGLPFFEGQTIAAAKYKEGDARIPTDPSITILKADYWDTIKDRPDIKALFAPQQGVHGVLTLLEIGDVGSSADASSPVSLPPDDGEALVCIMACTDLERLMDWAASNNDRNDVMAALSRRIAIVESDAERGHNGQLGAEAGAAG